jgi:hypothetical protein
MATLKQVDHDPFAASPFDAALKAEGVSGAAADVARSIYQQESGSGKNTKTSNAGAVGGMQIRPATFKGVADEGWDINDPVHNARAGIRYVQQMSEQAGGDPALTAAGYYGGPGGLEKARKGVAVSDPRNPNAPNTLQYGQQVVARLAPNQAAGNPKAGGEVQIKEVDFDPFAKTAPTPEPRQPAVSKDYQSGRDAPGWKQGLASVVNGPLMGFGDEVLGGLGAMIDKAKNPSSDLSANYKANRDTVRGMQDAQAEENPWTTGITQAMAAAPMLVLNPLGKLASGAVGALPQALRATGAAPAVTGMLPNAVRAAGTGLGYGAVQGAGDSRADTLNGVMADAATTGLTSAALSGVASPVAAVLGAGAKNIGQRFSKAQAGEAAKQKIAEALARDARGEVFTSGQSNPITQVQKRFDRLGTEATVADAGGRNTNQLLDTLATLPGRTKDAAEQLIHTRQAGRAGRLVTAAEDGLSTQGQRLSPNLMQWIDDRQVSSAPLYEQLRQTSITPSSNLQALVASADELGAVKLGREMATARQQPFSLDAAPSPRNGVTNQLGNQTWTMGDLDHVKQGLDQKIAKQWDAAAGKLTPLGAAYQDLKTKLVGELDTATFDAGTGSSLYKSARDAFSGPSALIDASQQGKLALTKDGVSIAGMLSPMSASEQQAFRLGAFEALRNKLGREAGQTEILKMWKEPATREKLASIFGSQANFRQFSADVAKEARLKGLESVGRGSQTAARQYGAGDLDQAALAEAGAAVGAAKTGNIIGAIGAAKSAWNRVATPQAVRDEMGGMLMSKGAQGRQNIDGLSGLVQQINDQNAMVSQGIGAVGSQIGSRLAPPMRTQPLASSEARAPGGAQASFADAPAGVNVRVNQPDAPFTVAPQQDGNPPADMAPAGTPNGTREEGAMVAPEFDTLAQAGELPAQDAAPAFTSSPRPDGTLAISGDANALRAVLVSSGIPERSMAPMNGGLLIGRTQAAQAQDAINRMQAPPEAVAGMDVGQPDEQGAGVVAQAPAFDSMAPEVGGPPQDAQAAALVQPGTEQGSQQEFASNQPLAGDSLAQAATDSGVNLDQAAPVEGVADLQAPPSEVMASQGTPESAGTLQPEAMSSPATRIQRLRDSGETRVADILQRRQTLDDAQTELASMQAAGPNLQHHADPVFNHHYQQQRLAGMKPAEASGHAGILAAIQSEAPRIGMSDAAVIALTAKLQVIPIDEAPGFIERFTQALIKRGMVQPFEGVNQMAALLEQARDSAMNGALDSLYGAHSS